MYSTTIFLHSLLVKYENDPVRKQFVLDFIREKINQSTNSSNCFRKKYNI